MVVVGVQKQSDGYYFCSEMIGLANNDNFLRTLLEGSGSALCNNLFRMTCPFQFKSAKKYEKILSHST